MPTPCLHAGSELQDGKLRETIITLGTPLEIRQGYPTEGRVTTGERQPSALKGKFWEGSQSGHRLGTNDFPFAAQSGLHKGQWESDNRSVGTLMECTYLTGIEGEAKIEEGLWGRGH